jgi:hypothetical protein
MPHIPASRGGPSCVVIGRGMFYYWRTGAWLAALSRGVRSVLLMVTKTLRAPRGRAILLSDRTAINLFYELIR